MKLDKTENIPRIVLDAKDLGLLPRFLPEQNDPSSLVIRVSELERQCNELSGISKELICEIKKSVALINKTDKPYAEDVCSGSNRVILEQLNTVPKQIRPSSTSQRSDTVPKQIHSPRPTLPESLNENLNQINNAYGNPSMSSVPVLGHPNTVRKQGWSKPTELEDSDVSSNKYKNASGPPPPTSSGSGNSTGGRGTGQVCVVHLPVV